MVEQVQTISRAKDLEIYVIRPLLRMEDFQIRGHHLARHRVRAIQKALRRLHTLETMAVGVYRLQIRAAMSQHNRQLIAAMCNAMSHLQDYLVLLYEYGARPAKRRIGWGIFGSLLGYGSRLLGSSAVLRTGIWIEKRAIYRYEQLLAGVDWESDTRAMLEKNIADQYAHLHRWKDLLRSADSDY